MRSDFSLKYYNTVLILIFFFKYVGRGENYKVPPSVTWLRNNTTSFDIQMLGLCDLSPV